MHSYTLATAIDTPPLAEQEAARRAMETLMNCYCREVAGPEGQLSVGPLFGPNDAPASVRLDLHRIGGRLLQIDLPFTHERLLTVVDGLSATGNYRYPSPFYGKTPGKPWALLDWRALVGVVLRELSLKYALPANDELMLQIRDSIAVTAAILETGRPGPFSAMPLQAFIESEQSLVFGHPFHPAPKSRQGLDSDERRRYSPEMGARFALHYFAVRREHLVQQSVLGDSCDRIIAAQAPAGLIADPSYALIPVHPWQARHLMDLPDVSTALRDGRLRDLGEQGEAYYATASIRTLFHPDHPYFYKCSLNVRITNCVRKNAVYELEGALQVTRIMRDLAPQLQQKFPALRVMEEPAFMSVDLRTGEAQADKAVTEGFGVILRRGFGEDLLPGVTPLVAGALFGNHTYGEARLRELMDAMCAARGVAADEAAEQWFSQYVATLMYPVLYCYFNHGVIFEPHLQNVVVGVSDTGPRQIFLRDFEGVKLVKERFGHTGLGALSARAREALTYSDEQGWKRIAYCLFVNNFCEAINQIGAGKPILQHRLWAVLQHHLYTYQHRYGDNASARRVNALLTGEPLPGKANLINRFFKRPDSASIYLPVTNPLGTLGGPRGWN
ncbi:MAG: iron transporter [Thiobacillus sp.]|nr:iron transporter [Thiobacillus sp.]